MARREADILQQSYYAGTDLQNLMRDIRSGTADFSTILVYDASRWERFQDADESAYYEFLCKEG